MWNSVWPVVDALALGAGPPPERSGPSPSGWGGSGGAPRHDHRVGGGAMRDVVLRQVPAILGGNTLYATCAALASGALVLLDYHGYPTAGSLTALVLGSGLCLLARWRGWILPSADAWAPSRVVPARYRLHRHRHRPRRRATDGAADTADTG